MKDLNQIHIYILLAIIRKKVDDKAAAFADKAVTTCDFSLEKVISLVYGEGNTEEVKRDSKKIGEKVETIEATKANGSTYRLPVFALQKVAQNMVEACSPWVYHKRYYRKFFLCTVHF